MHTCRWGPPKLTIEILLSQVHVFCAYVFCTGANLRVAYMVSGIILLFLFL